MMFRDKMNCHKLEHEVDVKLFSSVDSDQLGFCPSRSTIKIGTYEVGDAKQVFVLRSHSLDGGDFPLRRHN